MLIRLRGVRIMRDSVMVLALSVSGQTTAVRGADDKVVKCAGRSGERFTTAPGTGRVPTSNPRVRLSEFLA